MKMELSPTVYRMLPVQVIEHREGAILKRGSLETRIGGERAVEILQRILDCTRSGATRETLREQFLETERPAIDYVFEQLVERRLLVPVEDSPTGDAETPEGIFFWEFGQSANAVRAELSAARPVIVGVNEISRELCRLLRRSGFQDVSVVDYPILRNMRLYRADGSLDPQAWTEPPPLAFEKWQQDATTETVHCVVATSDHGGLHWMRHWNQLCVANRLDFFPVVLQNMIGYIGPYIVPGETACFECLRARQNAHLIAPEQERAFELVAFEAQDVVGFHPTMASAVAAVAAMELVKLMSRKLPFTRVASLIELNLLVPRLTNRKVLRIPNCTVCRMLQEVTASTADKNEIMPGNRE